MTSICSSQTSYQHFQLTHGNGLMLLPSPQQTPSHQHQLIAPKLPLGNSQLQNIQQSGVGPLLSKKKYNYSNMPYGEQLPSVARRNARERNRVKQVNNGFVNLRQHLPQTVINTLSNGGRGASKKLSKVDTLRIAVEYIRGLQDLLEDGSSSRPLYNPCSSADESSNDASYQDYQSSLGSPQSQFVVGHSYRSSGSSPSPTSFSDSDHSGGSYVKQELKFESFDSFSDDQQPDDEELLDYISSWQEQ